MILGCGLSRTGNKSLGNALKILGYNPVKYPKSIEELGVVYDAAVDITVIAWLDELELKFPDAKWILTVRDIDPWLRSCERWFGRSLADCSSYKQAYLLHYRKIVYGTESFDPILWQEVYHRHIDKIKTKFEDRTNQLLIMDICQGESWEKLCHFLDKSVPDVPFPSIS